MIDSSYLIRNYQPADFHSYVEMVAEAERRGPIGRCSGVRVIRGMLTRPNYRPEQDLFIIEKANKIVGYIDIATELNIGRVIIDCPLPSDYWRGGLAANLLDYATELGRESGVRIAHVNIAHNNEIARSILSDLGFKLVRRFLILRLKITKVHRQYVNYSTVQYRHLQQGEEDKLTKLQNRAFTGTWGYNINSVQEVIHSLGLAAGGSNKDVIVALDGDRLVGYCWTRPTCRTDNGTAQIFMVGVDPDYRGHGIGKGVLLSGLLYLSKRDSQVVELTVDSNNQVANMLYWSVGFRLWTSSLWYEKPITQ